MRWGTITATSPLRIRLDGDTDPLPLTPDSLVDPLILEVGDRVRCEVVGRVVIVGKSGGTPAGPFFRTVPLTTSSLADNASQTTTMDLGSAFTLLHVTTSHAARVRVYQSVAHRTADASRAVGVMPAPGSGLIFEDDGSAASNYSTVVPGGLLDGVASAPVAITNRSGATRAITVTLEVRS